MFLLDTNACIRLLNDPRTSAIARKLESLQPGDVKLCNVVIAELYYGVYRSLQQERNLNKVNRFISQFETVPFNRDAAAIFGRIRAQLAATGKPIGPYDLQIAAIALAHDLTLVTNNTREFCRIEGLKLEDWQQEK